MLKLSYFFHKYFKVLAAIYFAIALYLFKDDYFFGDAITSTSRLACNIYKEGSIFYITGYDPGHPPTYSLILVFFWKIFGETLFVSHAYGIAWCIFLFLGFRKVCHLFLDKEYVNYASVLVLIHPTFISQNAMMINTAMLMGCFLWAIYYFFSKQNVKLTLLLSIMILSHLEGAFFLASLAVADYLLERNERGISKFIKLRFFIYTVPFLVFLSWLVLHHHHSGWWLISPDYAHAHEHNSMVEIFKGLLYCAWRFLDYGMIVPFIIYLLIKYKNRKFYNYDYFFWITLIITSVIMSVVLNDTIAHRYFLVFELLFVVLVVKEISLHGKRKVPAYIFILTAFFAGNFIYYPGKTIADANIQYRSYFAPYNRMLNDLPDTLVAYSKAPIANGYDIVNIEAVSKLASPKTPLRINDNLIDTLTCIVTSNVCAEFTKEENDNLSTWYGNSYERGAVYINVYLNPKYVKRPEDWKLREPGSFEKWMIKMKNKLK